MKKTNFTIYGFIILGMMIAFSIGCEKDEVDTPTETNNTTDTTTTPTDTSQTASLASLTTTTASSVTENSAESGGNISSDGGSSVTARGVCWSTSSNPTITDSTTNNGSGTGSFSSSLSGLSANTTYYIRAYATNNAGTAYGGEKSFTTSASTTPVEPVAISFNGTLYVHPTDNSTGIQWYNGSYITTNATSTTDGSANTDSIVKYQSAGAYAAYLCDTLTAFGHSDWYLPAKDELNALYQNKDVIGGFSSNYYWSSTEYDNSNAWDQGFGSGNQYSLVKFIYVRVRCVRRD